MATFTAINTLSTEVDGKMDSMTVDTTPTSGSTNLVTSGGVYSAINTVTATATSAQSTANSALPKSGGTMTGILTAQNNTSYTTKQVRNITLSTSSPSGGSNGDLWFVYE